MSSNRCSIASLFWQELKLCNKHKTIHQWCSNNVYICQLVDALNMQHEIQLDLHVPRIWMLLIWFVLLLGFFLSLFWWITGDWINAVRFLLAPTPTPDISWFNAKWTTRQLVTCILNVDQYWVNGKISMNIILWSDICALTLLVSVCWR